jgi:uncharacterized membrane protein YccC
MKFSRRHFASLLGALSLTVAGAGLSGASPMWNRDRDYPELREVVDRTQSDLRAAVDLEHGGKQADRYRNAQDHLSDFDRSISKGHFDKDRLDRAIGDLQSLLDHNTLQASTREALRRDVEDLRVARDHYGH